MSDLELRIETAYCMGTIHNKISDLSSELKVEVLLEDLMELVDKVVADFNEWQQDKDDSALELLHQFIFNEMNLRKYLEEIVK